MGSAGNRHAGQDRSGGSDADTGRNRAQFGDRQGIKPGRPRSDRPAKEVRLDPFPGVTGSVCVLRPESRGRVQITSTDPLQPPSMLANYLSTDLDRRTAVAAVRAARSIASAPAMQPYVKREIKPGPDARDDAALLEYCRNNGATIFHPSGTCKMGHDDLAVVDTRLRVHGIDRLRVVDCSVMPTLVSGNTNAPVIAIAEKAASSCFPLPSRHRCSDSPVVLDRASAASRSCAVTPD